MQKRWSVVAPLLVLGGLLQSCNQSPSPSGTIGSGATGGHENTALSPKTLQQRGQPPQVGKTLKSSSLSTLPRSHITYVAKSPSPFGPRVYTRGTGKPEAVTDQFTAKPGRYILSVDAKAVSSAVITLNGVQVASPGSFDGSTRQRGFEVELREKNTLSVELRGQPGSSTTVRFDSLVAASPITGRFITASGAPVGGARVNVILTSTGRTLQSTTSADGTFAVSGPIDMGSFIIEGTSADGTLFASVAGGLLNQTAQAQAELVLMERGLGTVSGVVRNEQGQPIPGALVSLSFLEKNLTATTVADSAGQYHFTQMPGLGSLAVSSYDPVSRTSGTAFSYLIDGMQGQAVDVTVKAPTQVTSGLLNGDFANGTTEGWDVQGTVMVVPKSSVFPTSNLTQLSTSAGGLTMQSASEYAGVVTTGGDKQASGALSRTFTLGLCDGHLVGTIRFLSDEYPTWYGTKYNDSYTVTVTTPYGIQTLAEGNLNSTDWGGGAGGFSGASAPIPVDIDLSQFAQSGEPYPITLSVNVSDVGDTIVDSAVALSDFQLTTSTDDALNSQSLSPTFSPLSITQGLSTSGLADTAVVVPPLYFQKVDNVSLMEVLPDTTYPFSQNTTNGFFVFYEDESQLTGYTFRLPVIALDGSGQIANTGQVKLQAMNVSSDAMKFNSGVLNGGMGYLSFTVTKPLTSADQISLSIGAIDGSSTTTSASSGGLSAQQIIIPVPGGSRGGYWMLPYTQQQMQQYNGTYETPTFPLLEDISSWLKERYESIPLEYRCFPCSITAQVIAQSRVLQAKSEYFKPAAPPKIITQPRTTPDKDPCQGPGKDTPDAYDGPDMLDKVLEEAYANAHFEWWAREAKRAKAWLAGDKTHPPLRSSVVNGKVVVRWTEAELKVLANAADKFDNIRGMTNKINRAGALSGLLKDSSIGGSLSKLYNLHHINSKGRNPNLYGEIRNLTVVKAKENVGTCHEGNSKNWTAGPLMKE